MSCCTEYSHPWNVLSWALCWAAPQTLALTLWTPSGGASAPCSAGLWMHQIAARPQRQCTRTQSSFRRRFAGHTCGCATLCSHALRALSSGTFCCFHSCSHARISEHCSWLDLCFSSAFTASWNAFKAEAVHPGEYHTCAFKFALPVHHFHACAAQTISLSNQSNSSDSPQSTQHEHCVVERITCGCI